MIPTTDSDPVAEAMRRRDRVLFLPSDRRRAARIDAPIPIAGGQTNSQPTTVRIMLNLLDVRPGQHVLDVGSGSGWTTALLADLVGPDGTVAAVERIPELVASSRRVLADLGQPGVSVRQAQAGVLGLPEQAPFDRILVSAEPQQMPQELLAQLAPGGVMVIPVAGRMRRVLRESGGIAVTDHGPFAFVPLVEE